MENIPIEKSSLHFNSLTCKPMKTYATLHKADTRRTAIEPQQFPPLELETRTHVPTAQAAFYLNRRPQTMRAWACLENGALRPHRIMGRLAWPVAELRRVLGVA